MMFRLRKKVNCDHNATTPVSRSVRKAMLKILTSFQANPSTPYRDGRLAAQLVEGARQDLAAALNVGPDTIIFTSGATEANNHLRSIAPLMPSGRRSIIYNPMEHPAVLEPLRLLAEDSYKLIAAEPDRYGRIGVADLKRQWSDEIGLAVLMGANNETGTLYDLKAMAEFVHLNGAFLFSDLVQALGKTPLDLTDLGVDYASFSAHKIYGPKGVGALYVKTGAPFAPFMVGGGQENGRRAGTESLHNLAGLAAAARDIPVLLGKTSGLRQLKETFIEKISEFYPRVSFNTPPGSGSQPGTVSLTLPGLDNAFLLGQLDFHGISAAAGSACRTGENDPSHALTAIGLSPEAARSTLRLSFGHDFSPRELAYVLKIFKIILLGDEHKRITVLKPGDLTEDFLFQKDLTVIHIKRFPRFQGQKPLPGSRVTALADSSAWEELKPAGPLLLTCDAGYDAPIMAWRLRRRGFKNLSVLAFGLWGLKMTRPDFLARIEALSREEGNEHEP
ncbi:MAG: aminotransferase class V-fold PLP-dependent enzyme [Deltaproteobacteria bacterium]|jgi:cysteine desulfurase|nr:aminotransferase class V-fold PLP-dependent enzyme [Deltaproteobacteria bacterium]